MIIGITGPIAAGKDIFIRNFIKFIDKKNHLNSNNQHSNRNVSLIIDADKIGKFIVESNFAKISKIFSVSSMNELSKFVFSDFNNFLSYNSFIHPILSEKLRKILINIKQGQILDKSFNYLEQDTKDKIIILNCALLFLFKLDFFCDLIIFIDAEKQERLNRIAKRNGLSKEDAIKRLEFQEKIENYNKIRQIYVETFYVKDFDKKNSYEKNIENHKLIYIENSNNIEKLNEQIEKIYSAIIFFNRNKINKN